VRDVEVVRLRSGGRDLRGELALHRRLAARDEVVVVADADDLDDPVKEAVVGGNWQVRASRSACGAWGSVTYQSAPR
jgi:hypothetical protein